MAAFFAADRHSSQGSAAACR